MPYNFVGNVYAVHDSPRIPVLNVIPIAGYAIFHIKASSRTVGERRVSSADLLHVFWAKQGL